MYAQSIWLKMCSGEVRSESVVCTASAILNRLTDAAMSFGLVLLNKETTLSLPPFVEKGQPHSSLCLVYLMSLGYRYDESLEAAAVGTLLTVG